MSKSNYYGHETPPAPSSSQQQRSPKSHEEFDNDYLLNDNDHIPFNLNSKQRLRLLLHDENNSDNDASFLEEEGTEVMNGVPPVDVSRLLLDYSILSTDNNGSIVAILHDERQQLHQPQPSPKTQQMKSSGNSNSSNKDEENNTQKKVNKTKKNRDSSSSWVYTTKDVMIEFIAPFHEGFGCTDASSDDNDDGGVQESPSRTPCKKQLSEQQQPSDDDKRGSDSTTDLSPSRHRNNQAASASSCGLIDIEEAIANLIAPFYTIEDGVSQELECIISCGMD